MCASSISWSSVSEAACDQVVEIYTIRVWRDLAPTDTLALAVAIGAQTSATFACGDWESSSGNTLFYARPVQAASHVELEYQRAIEVMTMPISRRVTT